MSKLTFLAYAGERCILEKDEETTSTDLKGIAFGLREQLPECTRVIVLKDGEFAFDTNDMRN